MEKRLEENYMHELDYIKRQNYYIIFVSVIIIVIASGFCMYRDLTRRVKEPIMLPVCMDVGVEITDTDEALGTASLQLYYITDNKFDNSIVEITFPERPELSCYVGEPNNDFVFSYDNSFGNENTNIWRQYGRYQINQIFVNIDSVPLEEEIKLTKVSLLWRNGKHTVVDIGTVNLYYDNSEQSSLEWKSSSSNTDGTTIVGIGVMEDVTIKSIESRLISYVDGKCTFDIDGDTYKISELNDLNLDLNKGSYIKIRINKQGLMEEKNNPYYFMDIQPRLLFNDKNGKQAYVRLYDMRYSLEYKLKSENQIHQYIKEREKE